MSKYPVFTLLCTKLRSGNSEKVGVVVCETPKDAKWVNFCYHKVACYFVKMIEQCALTRRVLFHENSSSLI